MGGVRADSMFAARTGLKDEHPHPVKLTKGFYIGVYEVTQSQWQSVMGTPVSEMRDKVSKSYQLAEVGSDYPMYYVNWEDCTKFCRKLSQKEGKTYRLPTEAEWECACRAGTTTKYSFGDDMDDFYKYGNYADSSIKVPNSDTKHNDGYRWLAPVGSYKPNGFGLYDMHGNVMEWCSDWYDKDYYEECMFGKADGTYIATKDAMIIKDPMGPKSGTKRIVRGGFYSIQRGQCTSTFRNAVPPKNTNTTVGFRVVLEIK
jgi:formylglycine-generating enzyme required for sulfatase activity